MAYNQDAKVSSSQDGVVKSNRGSSAIPVSSRVKQNRMIVNPHLKMVAKVFPTVRKEEEKPEAEELSREKLKTPKKQLYPWLVKFNALCREAAGNRSYKRLDDLMDVYIRQVAQDVKNCYKKPNRASKLKMRMNDYMKLFHMLYTNIRRPLEHNYYLDRMSDLLAMYLDMEIKASRRGKESPQAISSRLMSSLFVLLDNSMGHILNAILKAKFFVKAFHEICNPIITRVLRDVPSELNEVSFIQYILVFKKWKLLARHREDRQRINRLAAAKLQPPTGFVDVYHDSDKYSGLLPVVARGSNEKFTLMLMQAPGLVVKDNGEGYLSAQESMDTTVKLLEDMELNSSVFSEEFTQYTENEDHESERRHFYHLKKIWLEIESLGENETDLDTFFEDEYMLKIKQQQEIEEKQRLEKLMAKKAPKIKKETDEEARGIMSGLGCVHHEVHSVHRCFGYTNLNSAIVKKEPDLKSENGIEDHKERRPFVKEVPKMEADSQSQDEIIVVNDDDDDVPSVKMKSEDQETSKRDMTQPSVLRAVVRPENIELLYSSESMNDEFGEKAQDIQDSLSESSCIQSEQELLKDHEKQAVQGGDDVVTVSMKEDAAVESEATSSVDADQPSPLEEATSSVDADQASHLEEATSSVDADQPSPLVEATSSVDADQPSPLEEPKSSDDLLLKEITKVSVEEKIPQLWNILDSPHLPNQPFGDIFDHNDPTCGIIFYPNGTENSQNWSFSQDFILGQCDDDLFSQYECGNTNAFPDFYNDMVFNVTDLRSPPLLDMMRDEPVEGEYNQMTTHWEELSMMVSDPTYNEKTNVTPEKEEESPEVEKEEEGPTVVFRKTRKGKCGRSKAKPKVQKHPTKETEQTKEIKANNKAAEDESKNEKQVQPVRRQKRVRFVMEGEEKGEESEPLPKRKKRQQGKSPAPAPSSKLAPASPAPSSPRPKPSSSPQNKPPPSPQPIRAASPLPKPSPSPLPKPSSSQPKTPSSPEPETTSLPQPKPASSSQPKPVSSPNPKTTSAKSKAASQPKSKLSSSLKSKSASSQRRKPAPSTQPKTTSPPQPKPEPTPQLRGRALREVTQVTKKSSGVTKKRPKTKRR